MVILWIFLRVSAWKLLLFNILLVLARKLLCKFLAYLFQSSIFSPNQLGTNISLKPLLTFSKLTRWGFYFSFTNKMTISNLFSFTTFPWKTAKLSVSNSSDFWDMDITSPERRDWKWLPIIFYTFSKIQKTSLKPIIIYCARQNKWDDEIKLINWTK